MNQLSWLIYLADVSGSIGGWLGFISALGALLAGLGVIVFFATRDIHDEDEAKAANRFSSALVAWGLPLGLICIVLSAATPSKETVYAIAASELGEQALKTPIMGKMGKALEAWLDEQIGDEPAPADAAA